MKSSRYLLLLLLLMAMAHSSFAQKEITFGSSDSRSSDRHRRSSHYARGGYAKNSISIGLISWLSGYTPVYYERSLISAVSLQVGLGFTSRPFTSDFSISSDEGAASDYFKGNGRNDIVDNYNGYKYRKSAPGMYLSISPKVYYTDDGMDGPYIAPMFELKQYRWNARLADVSAPVDYSSDAESVARIPATQAETMRCLDLTINFGGHYQSSNHVVFGWSTGIGVRNAHSSRLDIGTVTDALGNTTYANAVQEYDKTKVLFTFQFVVGGWF